MARLFDDPPDPLPGLSPSIPLRPPQSERPPYISVLEYTFLLEAFLDAQGDPSPSPEHAGLLESALAGLRAWMAEERIDQPCKEYQALCDWLDTYGEQLVALAATAAGIELCKRLLFLVHVPATSDAEKQIASMRLKYPDPVESPQSRGVRDSHSRFGMPLQTPQQIQQEDAAALREVMRDYKELSRDLLIGLLTALLCGRHPTMKNRVLGSARVFKRMADFVDA